MIKFEIQMGQTAEYNFNKYEWMYLCIILFNVLILLTYLGFCIRKRHAYIDCFFEVITK